MHVDFGRHQLQPSLLDESLQDATSPAPKPEQVDSVDRHRQASRRLGRSGLRRIKLSNQ